MVFACQEKATHEDAIWLRLYYNSRRRLTHADLSEATQRDKCTIQHVIYTFTSALSFFCCCCCFLNHRHGMVRQTFLHIIFACREKATHTKVQYNYVSTTKSRRRLTLACVIEATQRDKFTIQHVSTLLPQLFRSLTAFPHYHMLAKLPWCNRWVTLIMGP